VQSRQSRDWKYKHRNRAGRKVMCNVCLRLTIEGETRVYKKLVFHFCPDCRVNRQGIERHMAEIWSGHLTQKF
jgi:hypothetical protein